MMKPTSTPRGKGPAKARRKTREEINQEARDRKRQKKHRGHAAGSRASGSEGASGGGNQNKQKDPRIGSKTPVPLVVENNKPVVAKAAKPKEPKQPKMSPEKELALLEQDERLNQLLDAVDEGKTLTAEEQTYVDNTLDRIDELMSVLGIDLGDEDDDLLDGNDEEEKKEDIVQLLKRSSSKE